MQIIPTPLSSLSCKQLKKEISRHAVTAAVGNVIEKHELVQQLQTALDQRGSELKSVRITCHDAHGAAPFSFMSGVSVSLDGSESMAKTFTVLEQAACVHVGDLAGKQKCNIAIRTMSHRDEPPIIISHSVPQSHEPLMTEYQVTFTERDGSPACDVERSDEVKSHSASRPVVHGAESGSAGSTCGPSLHCKAAQLNAASNSGCCIM